ncbi:MAG: LemA family protein [Proteobacteria bacterium]|jgi:LemA protein|nr:LemA family protein [Pseudomonadota bacterium]MDA1298998.1 LemA family protein [Pseudomonadota bacterium]
MTISTWILIGVIAALLLWLIAIYNQLVALRNRYQNGFAQIEVQLKRRYDLIPNLVEAARAYLSHERETLEAVIQARDQAAAGLVAAARDPGNAAAIRDLAGKEQLLTTALGRFNAVVENYPDLKADQTIAQLTEELTSTENRIAFARQAFNDGIMRYNTYRQSFPNIVVAGWLGHGTDAELLEFADRQQIAEPPRISF